MFIYRFGSHRGDHELVGLAPNFRVGAGQEDAGMRALDSIQRVSFIDFLGEEGGLFEHMSYNLRVVGVINRSAHDGSPKDTPVGLEEPFMIAKMVWVDLSMASNEWQTRRPWWVADGTSIDQDADWFFEL